MVFKYNRNYKQHLCDIQAEFPNKVALVKLDGKYDYEGYLIAVGSEPKQTEELEQLAAELNSEYVYVM